jgi:4-hydroxy-tetrahydrodipicolinate reductase
MANLRLAVVGAAGRMGQTLVRCVKEQSGCSLAAALERPGSLALGQDAGLLAGVGNLCVPITDGVAGLTGDVDGILDFTAPEASVTFARMAARSGLVHVIGTTGLAEEHRQEIAAAAKTARIVLAGNMSLGVNLLVALTRKVAQALDADFDIEVVEMHHKHKVDAPSGTALMLGEAAATGRGVDLASHAVRSRDGHTGARPRGHIGFATLRGGNVVGEHTVVFAGEGERLELTHKATDRAIFARGAVKAALWAQHQPPGLYSMADVLGIG